MEENIKNNTINHDYDEYEDWGTTFVNFVLVIIVAIALCGILK